MKNARTKSFIKLKAFALLFAVGTTSLTEVSHATHCLLDPKTNNFRLDSSMVCSLTAGGVLSARGMVVQEFLNQTSVVQSYEARLLPILYSGKSAKFFATRITVNPVDVGIT
eukprot:6106328-Ditylum_brightwellii.AAC.1